MGNIGGACIAWAMLAGLGCGGASTDAKSASGPNAPVKIAFEVHDYTLPNGMRVILDEDKAAPVVAVHVRYKVGSKDDPPGRAGFAHLFEHLKFEGTRSIEGDVYKAMFQAGATDVNASTSRDRTEYHETFPSSALEWAIWFEAERMATMGERLDQAAFDRERMVVKNELRENYENKEGGFFSSAKRTPRRRSASSTSTLTRDPIGSAASTRHSIA